MAAWQKVRRLVRVYTGQRGFSSAVVSAQEIAKSCALRVHCQASQANSISKLQVPRRNAANVVALA